MTTLTDRAESGSLSLTLLAAIILGGVVIVTFTIVSSGVSTSGRDRDFAAAIHAADSGLQEGYLVLSDAIEDDAPFTGVTCTQPDWFLGDNTATNGACASTLGSETEFDWEYTCDATTSNCEVLSVGRYRGSARAVEAQVVQRTLQQIGITGEASARWAGGGSTSSTGIFMGTFGCVQIPDSAPGAIVGIYYFGDDPDRHLKNPCWRSQELALLRSPESGMIPNLEADIAAEACAGETALADIPSEVSYGERLCVRRAHFPSDFQIIGNAEADGPLTVNVVNPSPGNNAVAVRVGGGGNALADEVNLDGAAGDLLINVGFGSGDVQVRTGASAAMTVWAPQSVCDIWPTGSYRGTITCQEVKLRGIFDFEGPDSEIVTQEPVIQRWSEEPVPPARRALASN